jgi:DNA-binding PadR family transcriptional regulator
MDLRGHLDLLLLATLRHTGPAHGYALMATLRERSNGEFDLPEGTVYPALHRLERDGLVASWWDDTTARRRRVYELTSAGADALVVKRKQWRDFASGMQSVVGRVSPEPAL